jgi:hypothetical protein
MICNERDFARALDEYLTKMQDVEECPYLRALPYYGGNYCDTVICILDCKECEGPCI